MTVSFGESIKLVPIGYGFSQEFATSAYQENRRQAEHSGHSDLDLKFFLVSYLRDNIIYLKCVF